MKPKVILMLAIVFILANYVFAAGPKAVPTFHCLGIYWSPSDGSVDNECRVSYSVSGSEQWKHGYTLWFDSRNGEYRGSIVNLRSGTTYEIKLILQGTATTETFTASTWIEDFPIGQTIYLPETSGKTYTISTSGTASGYVLYTHDPGSSTTIDVQKNHDYCIEIASSTHHVIIRDLTLRGAKAHGIKIWHKCTDIVIEGCNISEWGEIDTDGFGVGYQSAIESPTSNSIKRIIVQRNTIHHPSTDTNDWDEAGHPDGPQAVTLWNTGGNHVIRYNDIHSDPYHYYNDILGAGSNSSETHGFPTADTDFYGNILKHCWDNAIESEGANRNVRIWGNYIDSSYAHIAIAGTAQGPIYIFRNLTAVGRRNDTEPWGTVYQGGFLKTGLTNNGGKVYVFHNTLLQPELDGVTEPAGVEVGIGHGGPNYNIMSRNNILHVFKNTKLSIRDREYDSDSDYDYDLYNGKIQALRPYETHGIHAAPIYDPSNGEDEFALDPSSPGYDAGIVLNNFNDGYTGAGPDMGAFEAGSPPMEFGVNAYIDVTPKYTFNVNVQGSGQCTINPCYSMFRKGTEVILTATPDLGWVFDSWTGTFTGTENPMTITTVDSGMTVTAVFTELPAGQYELRVNTSGSGGVTVDPPGNIHYEGTVVTLTAIPDSDWVFSNWEGDWESSNNPETIIMDSHKSISAIFVPIKYYNLNIDIIGSGKVILDPSVTRFVEGKEVTLTAVPDSGWVFDSWSGDLSSQNNPDTILMNSLKEVTANFMKEGSVSMDLTPTDDSYIRGGKYADNSYNIVPFLRVEHGTSKEFYRYAYLKFDLSSINSPIFNAILKLTVKKRGLTHGSPARADIYSVKDDNWIEGTITWNNAPSTNDHLDSVTDIVSEGKVYNWNVTSFVDSEIMGDKVVSLMLKDNGPVDKQVDFYSRESDYSPVLTVMQASTGVAEFQEEDLIPKMYQLYQNYPNPFNSCTRICYHLPKSGRVKLTIYDVRARIVSVLVNCIQDPGTHDVMWETGSDKFASGVYLCRLQVNNFIKTMKMLLLQ